MINKIRNVIAVTVMTLTAAFSLSAIDLPTTVVNGKEYYYYDVQPKETLFSLSQRLGISRDEIISYNPGVADGLKAYTRLYFPVESGHSAIATADHVTTTHTVKKGETLYGISKRYGISVDRLIALNPSARDGVKSGETLTIVSEMPAPSAQPVTASHDAKSHVIAQGETLYRIAANNGITVEQLLNANPSLDALNYAEGTVITIPAAGQPAPAAQPSAPETAQSPQPAPMTDAEPASEPAETASLAADENAAQPDAETNVNDPLNIAILLPFNLNEENPGRNAENFTEFYRGVLLAADELNGNGRKVNITAYDTRGDMQALKEIFARPEIKEVDMFVGPASGAELDYAISQADADSQFIFNIYSVRNDTYKDNPNVMQANIPHAAMYQRAIDAFLTEMNGRTPIFLQRIGATADKEEFTAMLKSRLADNGIEFKDMTFEHNLKAEDFAEYDVNASYVIIPTSSSVNEFAKFAPSLMKFQENLSAAGNTLALFGYPEWLTFRGGHLANLGLLNATIYSRFYNDATDSKSRALAEKYRKTYGREMNPAVPSQAIMGYDTATYLINSMRRNNGDFHIDNRPFDGLQTNFDFSDSDCEGLVNTSVELIKFSDGGFTTHRKI